MAGCELLEAYPVVPLSEDHALSIGIFTYCGSVFFGLYADPQALPDVGTLAAALRTASSELAGAGLPVPLDRRAGRNLAATAAQRRRGNHTALRGAS
jgi:diacylglycerol O-acyltransferase